MNYSRFWRSIKNHHFSVKKHRQSQQIQIAKKLKHDRKIKSTAVLIQHNSTCFFLNEDAVISQHRVMARKFLVRFSVVMLVLTDASCCWNDSWAYRDSWRFIRFHVLMIGEATTTRKKKKKEYSREGKKKIKEKEKVLAGLWRPPDEPLWWLVFIHHFTEAGGVGGPLGPWGTDLSVAMPPGPVHPSSFVTTAVLAGPCPCLKGCWHRHYCSRWCCCCFFNLSSSYSFCCCYYYYSSLLFFFIFFPCNIHTKLIWTNGAFIYEFWKWIIHE